MAANGVARKGEFGYDPWTVEPPHTCAEGRIQHPSSSRPQCSLSSWHAGRAGVIPHTGLT